MKLMHALFAVPIVFKENSIPTLIFENPVVFRNITTEIIRQSEGERGRFVLSSEDKPLDCAGHMNVFFDYAHLESIEKRIQTKALTLFLHEIQETMAKDIYELSRALKEFMGKLATASEYPVTYEQGENISALLKAMDFRIDLDGLPPCEALYEHMALLHKLSKKQCFVLINAHSYFGVHEIKEWASNEVCFVLSADDFEPVPPRRGRVQNYKICSYVFWFAPKVRCTAEMLKSFCI